MKFNRILAVSFLYAVLISLAGCVKEEYSDVASMSTLEPEIDCSAPTFNVGISDPDEAKVGIDSERKLYWTYDDRVSVFNSTDQNLQYVFTGETGSRNGVLQKVADGTSATGNAIDAKYAVYPYSESTSISSEGVLSVTLPAVQTYSSNSFGGEANIMAAISNDDNFNFKNAGCYMVVRLYGDATVQKLVLTSTNGEKLSGDANITFNEGVPTLTMCENASTSVTLDCESGVKLNESSDKASEFWFVLPPVTFSQGFTIQAVCSEGSFAKQKITTGTIHRNEIISVSAYKISTAPGKYIGKIKDSEIWNMETLKKLAKSFLGDQYSKYESFINLGISMAKSSGVVESGDIRLSRIKYTTTDPSGNVVEASGIVAFPVSFVGSSSLQYDKLVSVQHFTCGIDSAPSTVEIPVEACLTFKKGNDVTVLADYLGYGSSQTGDLQHPYMHNEKTGSACADLIEAAQEFLAEEGLKKDQNWKIELVGYSQGGAGTISTLQELEKRGYSNIGDVYAGGGPLDLKVFIDDYLEKKTSNYAFFAPYAVRGMVYGDRLVVDYHKVFAEEVFTSGAFDMFSTVPNLFSWNSVLGSDLTKILHPDFFVEGYNGNADIIKICSSLEKNSCSLYTPKNKSNILLYHSKTDDIVPYECSRKAAENWGITLNDLEKDGHIKGAIEFYGKYLSETLWDYIKDFL